jgi:Ca2+-binding EF-hand superfamily protein
MRWMTRRALCVSVPTSGGVATPADAFRMFRFFDNDREGVISVASLRLALQRLNVVRRCGLTLSNPS